MRIAWPWACAALLMFTSVSGEAAASPEKMTVGDIRACVARNLAERGSIRDLEIVTTDRGGRSESLRAMVFWKPTRAGQPRINVRVVEPSEIAGAGILVLPAGDGGAIDFVHLPGDAGRYAWRANLAGAAREAMQAILGGGQARRLRDRTVSGRRAFVIETRTVARGKIQSSIDRATCLPLESELFSASGELEKVFAADVGSILSVEPHWLALRFTLRDLREGTRTTISLRDLYLNEYLPEATFAPETFSDAE